MSTSRMALASSVEGLGIRLAADRVPFQLRVALIGVALAIAVAAVVVGLWLVVVAALLVVAGQVIELRARAKRITPRRGGRDASEF